MLQGYMKLARLSVEREVVVAVWDSETFRWGIFRTPHSKSFGNSREILLASFPHIDIN